MMVTLILETYWIQSWLIWWRSTMHLLIWHKYFGSTFYWIRIGWRWRVNRQHPDLIDMDAFSGGPECHSRNFAYDWVLFEIKGSLIVQKYVSSLTPIVYIYGWYRICQSTIPQLLLREVQYGTHVDHITYDQPNPPHIWQTTQPEYHYSSDYYFYGHF